MTKYTLTGTVLTSPTPSEKQSFAECNEELLGLADDLLDQEEDQGKKVFLD